MKRFYRSYVLLLCGSPLFMTRGAPESEAWPHSFSLPTEKMQTLWQADRRAKRNLTDNRPEIELWVPEGAERIRAVFLIANNTDSVKIGEHKRVREVAAKHGIAIMHLAQFSGNVIERSDPPTMAEESFDIVMSLAVEKTGLEDFKTAPWITLGKSSRGRFPFRTTWWFPERVIASISYHGEVPSWPMAEWSKAGGHETPLHLNIQGLGEWDGTWYRHVRPGLLNYNTQTGWLAHQVVIYGVDHGYYMDYYLYPNHGARLEKDHKFTRVTQAWDYIAAFIDTAMDLRVPKELPKVGTPVDLRSVDRKGGFLIHPRAPEELLGTKWFAFRQNDEGRYQTIPWPDEVTPVFDTEQGIVPVEELVKKASEVPEDQRGGYMWIPNRDLLERWLDLHNLYKRKDAVLKSLSE